MSDQSAQEPNQQEPHSDASPYRPPVPPVPPAPRYAPPVVPSHDSAVPPIPPAPPYASSAVPAYDTAVPSSPPYAPPAGPIARSAGVAAPGALQPQSPPAPLSPAPYSHPYGQQPAYAMPPASRPTSGLAVAALVCGIAGLVLSPAILFIGVPLLISIAAAVLGHVALSQLKKQPELGGKGMAITGLVLGYIPVGISLLLLVLGIIAAVLFGAFAIPFLSS